MTGVDLPAQKRLMREHMKQRRGLVSSEVRIAAAHAASLLFQRHVLPKYQTIAAYWAMSQEIDTLPILQMCLNAKKDLFLPKLHVATALLTFHRVIDFSELTPGQYGIREPSSTAIEIDPASLDLIIMPALAVDQSGNRLGMGGGFYDRVLAPIVPCPVLLAYVYACQRVVHVAHESWDVPVDGVLTENELNFFY